MYHKEEKQADLRHILKYAAFNMKTPLISSIDLLSEGSHLISSVPFY